MIPGAIGLGPKRQVIGPAFFNVHSCLEHLQTPPVVSNGEHGSAQGVPTSGPSLTCSARPVAPDSSSTQRLVPSAKLPLMSISSPRFNQADVCVAEGTTDSTVAGFSTGPPPCKPEYRSLPTACRSSARRRRTENLNPQSGGDVAGQGNGDVKPAVIGVQVVTVLAEERIVIVAGTDDQLEPPALPSGRAGDAGSTFTSKLRLVYPAAVRLVATGNFSKVNSKPPGAVNGKTSLVAPRDELHRHPEWDRRRRCRRAARRHNATRRLPRLNRND